MTEAKLILNRLLDKYEQSVHFIQPGRSNRRVLIKAEKGSLPEYDYENADVRDAYNTAIHFLEKKEIIFAKWLPGRKQMVAKEIWLNLNRLETAYKLAERQSLHRQIDEYCKIMQVSTMSVNTPWIKTFLNNQVEKLCSDNHLIGLYRKGIQHIKHILNALESYDHLNDKGITMRAFSIICYHDSKFFEKNIRDDFLSIARQYHPPLVELLAYQDLSVREQLAYLGIYVRPEIYEFAGSVKIKTIEGICDFSPLSRYGCTMTQRHSGGYPKALYG